MSVRSASRAKFEKQGVFLTRLELQSGNLVPPENLEAVTWLAEQEHKSKRREAIRYWWMLGFTIVAAASATIGAWPVVKAWVTN